MPSEAERRRVTGPAALASAVSAAVLLALALLALSAPTPAGAQSGERSQSAYRYYVACGMSAKAKPSHRCAAPRTKAAFFRSNNADVNFKLCVKFPGRGTECSPPRKARKGVLYVNEITSTIRGVHRVTWFAGGKRVGVFNLLVPRKR